MKLYSDVVALIPAYNEEKNIKEVIEKCKKFTKNIIVIDDGSTDNTKKLAEQAGAIVLNHINNTGKGEAMKTGINHIIKNLPKMNYIVMIDADMQYDPHEAEKLIQPLENKKADFVMGYRNWSQVPFRHKLGNYVWRTVFNFLFNSKLKDTNCGFIALNKKAINSINNMYGGYIIENSILAECIVNNLKIEQVPVTVNYKNVSPVIRGARMVSGILLFIIQKGINYKLSK